MKSFIIALLVCISQTHAQTPTPSPNFDCPNNDQEGGSYPNPTDCTKYYECSNGNAWELSCPPGLVFNPSLGYCDFPTGVDCRNPTATPPTTTSTTTPIPPTSPTNTANPTTSTTGPSTSTDLTVSSTASPPTTSSSPVPSTTSGPTNKPPTTPGSGFQCPNDDPDGGMHPHPTDCTKYYECSNGTPYELDCPLGTVFDPNLLRCDFPTGNECSIKKLPKS